MGLLFLFSELKCIFQACFFFNLYIHVPWKKLYSLPPHGVKFLCAYVVLNFCVLTCRWQVLRRDCHAMVITFGSSGNHWLLFIFDTEMYMQARGLSWYRAWPAYFMVDCMSHSRIVHLYGDVTIAILEKAAKLGPWSALKPTDARAWFFHLVSSEGPPHHSYDKQGDVEDLF